MVLPVLTGVSALLRDHLFPDDIWVWKTVAQDQLQVQMETRRILSQAASQFLCPEGSGQVLQKISGGLLCVHRCASRPGRPAFSCQYFLMEHCGTASALGAWGKQKALAPGSFSVPVP